MSCVSLVGITVLLGKAPTSLAVYVGFVAALAQAYTPGSDSVVRYPFASTQALVAYPDKSVTTLPEST